MKVAAKPAGRFDILARRRSLPVIRKIIIAAVFLTVCRWAFIGWSLWSENDAAQAAGRANGLNLTAAFASELTTKLDFLNVALQLVDNDIKALASGGGVGRLQSAIAAVVGYDVELRVVGPDGRVALSTIPLNASSANFGRQAHFIAHRDDRTAGLIVDPPLADAVGNTLEVSRRLETADGNFAGELMLLLKPAALLTLHDEIKLGRRGRLLVIGTDGIVRAGFDQGHPDGLLLMGADLSEAPHLSQLAPDDTVTYIRQDRADGVGRLVTVRGLAGYKLRVAVALDLDDVMTGADNHVWLLSVVGVAATMVMGILTLLLLREVWRRTRQEIELAHDRGRLHSAQARIKADRARLVETNRELLASKSAAEAANRARSQFLAHMSHELRTPLHAIIGFSELIQDQAPDRPGSPPIAGYAADIWSSGRHLLELINGILDISKVESGTATLTELVFPVAELIRDSLVPVRAQAEARNIPIELQLPEAPMRVWADRTRLMQVLINLLANAVKFTPDNGHITLAAAESEAGELVFSVSDTGIGMTEAEIEIALEPFGQVDNALSRSFQGTGLGLPLARKLTELHHGRLEVCSVKGKGTTVRVILPAERLRQREGARIA